MAGLPVSTDVAWFVGMGANILVLLACGAVFRGPRLDRLKRLLAPSIILNIVGFLLSVWPTGVTANDDPVALLGAIALGMGQAIMFLLWADVFNRAKIEEAEIALPLSSLVVLAYAVVVPLLPASLNGIPMLVAPLASGATLYLSFQRLPVAQACEKAVAIEGSRPHSMVKELARIAVPLAVFYLVVSWNGLLSQFEMTGERSLPEIIGSLAGVLCIVVFVLFSLKIDFAALFRWLCPLATLALILNFWKSPASAMAVCSISSVLDITIWIVTYLYSSRMARRDYGTSLTRIAVCWRFLTEGRQLAIYSLLPFWQTSPSKKRCLKASLLCWCVCWLLRPWSSSGGRRFGWLLIGATRMGRQRRICPRAARRSPSSMG